MKEKRVAFPILIHRFIHRSQNASLLGRPSVVSRDKNLEF
jgi:hypothetical protein